MAEHVDPARSVAWCFTDNNYTMSSILFKKQCPLVKYICFGQEVGENGTEHLQGYVEFKNKKSIAQIHKIEGFERVHLEVRKGTAQQARDYCEKDAKGELFHEVGEISQQGRRNDLDKVGEMIVAGKELQEVAMANPKQWMMYHGGIKTFYDMTRQIKRDWEMDVRVYWGKTGSGKSRAVWDEFGVEAVYPKPYGQWFDFYNGEEVVLVDDFNPQEMHGIKYREWLHLMDRYPMQVQRKGGSLWFASKIIIFTSNYDPEDWGLPDQPAFMRRVSQVKHFL